MYGFLLVSVDKVRGQGGSAPCSDFSPCNMSLPDWIDKVLFYAQITPNQLGMEWVWGLLQPAVASSDEPLPLLHMTTLTTD